MRFHLGILGWITLGAALLWVAISLYVQYLDFTSSDVSLRNTWSHIALYMGLLSLTLLFIFIFRRVSKRRQ
jgi:membrane protein DedA with SNARE-associated domain